MNTQNYFNSNVAEEIQQLLSSNENPYINFLKSQIENSTDELNLQKLIKYGLDNISDSNNNIALSTYFFILSGLKDLDAELRSFLMDMMVYCENKHIGYKNITEIREYFEKSLSPLLHK